MRTGTVSVAQPGPAHVGVGQYGLIVARDTRFIEYYRRTLLGLGLTTVIVSTHEAAASCLRLLVFDLAVLDETLGASQHRLLLQHFRKLNRPPTVLVVTCKKAGEPDADVWQSEAVEFVRDPASPVEIAQKLGGECRVGHGLHGGNGDF